MANSNAAFLPNFSLPSTWKNMTLGNTSFISAGGPAPAGLYPMDFLNSKVTNLGPAIDTGVDLDIDIYADPVNGNDFNNGTINKPVRTLRRISSLIKKGWNRNCKVHLAAGAFTVPATFNLFLTYPSAGAKSGNIRYIGADPVTYNSYSNRVIQAVSNDPQTGQYIITDNVGGFTAGELQGKLMKMTSGTLSGQYLIIGNNTVNQIFSPNDNLSGLAITDTFDIVERVTIFNLRNDTFIQSNGGLYSFEFIDFSIAPNKNIIVANLFGGFPGSRIFNNGGVGNTAQMVWVYSVVVTGRSTASLPNLGLPGTGTSFDGNGGNMVLITVFGSFFQPENSASHQCTFYIIGSTTNRTSEYINDCDFGCQGSMINIDRCVVEKNTMGSGNGINIIASGGNITNCDIRENSQNGIFVQGGNVIIQNVKSTTNNNGIGLVLADQAKVTIQSGTVTITGNAGDVKIGANATDTWLNIDAPGSGAIRSDFANADTVFACLSRG